MLSKTLSIIFKVFFVLTLLYGLLKTVGNVILKPISYHQKDTYSTLSFYKPGREIWVRRVNINERFATDTTIIDRYANSQHFIGKDTQVTFITEDIKNVYDADSITPIHNESIQTNIKMPVKGKIFNLISEQSEMLQKLRVYPKTTSQYIFFILIDILIYGSAALVFLACSVLFRNFSKKNFFTVGNIQLLKRAGIYILIPQLTLIVFYFTYHSEFDACKVFKSSEGYKILAQYSLAGEIQVSLITVGIGLLILSHIFKKGLEYKEEASSYI